MSLWKFNGAELEADFTDAAFMERFENAYKAIEEDQKHVLKVGKMSERIRSHCEVFFKFFDSVFGEGTKEKLFGDKVSVNLCVDAAESLYIFRMSEEARYRQIQTKYMPSMRGHLPLKNKKGKRS